MTTPRKAPDAFRTIGEVADWLGVETHVLRFWESKFAEVKPVKRAGGRRYYRPEDMALLGGLKQLLHEDGLTIRGAQKVLAEKGPGHVRGRSKPLEEAVTGEAGAPAQHALPFEDPAAGPVRGLNGTGAAHRPEPETPAAGAAADGGGDTAGDGARNRPAPDAGDTTGDGPGHGAPPDEAPAEEAPHGPAEGPGPRDIPRAEIARVLERARALRRRMEEAP